MTDTVVFGMAPSWLKKGGLCKSLVRLAEWAEKVGLVKYEFHNVIQHPIDSPKFAMVDQEFVLRQAEGKTKIVALGSFVSDTLRRLGIPHHRISHPSARNRQFNDPTHESRMLEGLKEYLCDTDISTSVKKDTARSTRKGGRQNATTST